MNEAEKQLEEYMQSIEKQKEILNERQKELEKVCWFCKEEKPEARENWAKYKLTRPERSHSYKVEKESVVIIAIPRCEKCKKIHQRKSILDKIGKNMMAISVLLAWIPLLFRITFFVEELGTVLWIGFLGGLAIFIIGNIIYAITFPKHTKKESYSFEYPLSQDLLNQGYNKPFKTWVNRQFGLSKY